MSSKIPGALFLTNVQKLTTRAAGVQACKTEQAVNVVFCLKTELTERRTV